MEDKPWTVAAPEEPARKRRFRVIMVDDEPDMLAVLRRWLSPMYETLALKDGGALVDKALEFLPDLVILDLALPDADGYELCRSLRAVHKLREVRILFLTGRDSDADFLEHLDAGGNGFLRKPVEREQLLEHVRLLLR